jgi:hypothetical protein
MAIRWTNMGWVAAVLPDAYRIWRESAVRPMIRVKYSVRTSLF